MNSGIRDALRCGGGHRDKAEETFFDRELFPVRLTNTGAFNLTKYGEQARRDGVSVRSGTGDFTRRLRLRRLGDDDGDTDNGDVEDILLKYFCL